MEKIGFGGGCHWCTEAVFQTLKGVDSVAQGWIAAVESPAFSEAVIVNFDEAQIDLQTLTGFHLYTHSSTSDHSRRQLYRSAIYVFNERQKAECDRALLNWQLMFDKPLITKVYWFDKFEPSPVHEQNYYYRDSSRPFCKTHIDPKLKLLLTRFSKNIDESKLTPADLPL